MIYLQNSPNNTIQLFADQCQGKGEQVHCQVPKQESRQVKFQSHGST